MNDTANNPQQASEASFWAAAETWLYSRLRLLLPEKPAPAAQRGWWPWSPAPDLEATAPDQESVRRQRAVLDAALVSSPPIRFAQLCAVLGLSPFERDVLLICLLHARNPIFAQLCAQRPECPGGQLTFALTLLVATDPHWDAALFAEDRQGKARLAANADWAALAPERPLRYWQLVEINQPGSQPLISAALRADEHVQHLVNEVLSLDHRLQPFCRRVPSAPQADDLSSSQSRMAAEAVHRLQMSGGVGLVQMPGGDGATKRVIATAMASALGRPLFRLALAGVPSTFAERELLARLWQRDALLLNLALLVEASDQAEALNTMLPLLDQPSALVFLDLAEPLRGQSTALLLDVARPTAGEQAAAWRAKLDPDSGTWPERLAAQFSLNLPELVDAAHTAALDLRTRTPDQISGEVLGRAVWATCRGRARPQLDGLAQRLVPAVRLDDVQLPIEEKRQLEQICAQARQRTVVYDDYGFRERLGRGLGITALFTGESGTGKTMAAEAIAGELDLDLYRIDLATVVSKYIGETEKNLRQIFDAAELSGAVLLFDEADALFGKRSEVRDSHDRYANIEVGYLLQRMESYGGLALLTSNMRNALDPAFLRRLRFIINFPLPSQAERQKIWAALLPTVWQAGLDLARLARPSLTGGQIRNIALGGAFLAAAAGEDLTMAMLHAAAYDELRKAGRPFPAGEFAGWVAASNVKQVA
jgi:hypothetical protein